jgi:deoxyadenosine/deoxycytidine kinase
MSRIALSGAIAVGKSTLAERLSGLHPKIQVHQEDVEEFHFLKDFYRDPRGFAFHSRVEFLAIKAAELAKSESRPGVATLLDRVLPELPTFAAVLRNSGLMSEGEYQVYHKLHAVLVESLPQFDAIIWVRCDTPTCLERIAERHRLFERNIDALYLDALDREYHDWIEKVKDRYKVLSVDTTSGDPGLPSMIVSWLEQNKLVIE